MTFETFKEITETENFRHYFGKQVSKELQSKYEEIKPFIEEFEKALAKKENIEEITIALALEKYIYQEGPEDYSIDNASDYTDNLLVGLA